MAHYDCCDCGNARGIAYGTCSACTPLEVFKVHDYLRIIRRKAMEQWEQSSLAKDFFLKIKCVEKERDEAKNKFIAPLIAEAVKAYQDVFDKYKPR